MFVQEFFYSLYKITLQLVFVFQFFFFNQSLSYFVGFPLCFRSFVSSNVNNF
eukprot:GAFH01005525.1.p3 GENE.GAFH01005525.1~~GAFH01005525.1.p3  ORF type:complete len:52 (-),score=0.40 GAFH01005525.1:19-174(-)